MRSITWSSTCAVSDRQVDLQKLVEIEDPHGLGDGDVGRVIQIEPQKHPLGLHQTHDAKPGAGDLDELSEGVVVAKKLLFELGSDHRLSRPSPRIPGWPVGAHTHTPLPNGCHLGGDTVDVDAPTTTPRFDPGRAKGHGDDIFDVGYAGERLGIVDGEFVGRASQGPGEAQVSALPGFMATRLVPNWVNCEMR